MNIVYRQADMAYRRSYLTKSGRHAKPDQLPSERRSHRGFGRLTWWPHPSGPQ
jgi:hypothetical protein